MPDCFLYFSPENPSQALLVEKASQRAYLYRSTDFSRPFRIYPCSTGKNSGPKSERNDKRTPEGIYYVTNSFKDQDLATIYGVRAFPIDYPNPLDRRLGRMGLGYGFTGPTRFSSSGILMAVSYSETRIYSTYRDIYTSSKRLLS
jgi:murein L,D-transpeptidase YafK